jgi:two-component system sensor histidine kinase/response regulator
MESDKVVNLVILAVVGAVVLFIFVNALKARRRRPKPEKKLGRDEAEQLFESKEDVPKLPRNETLYHIIKNSSLTVNKIPFDLNYVFDEVASLLRSDVSVSNTEVLFDIDADIPAQLIGSPKRLSRVLINLIENAVQYSNDGVVQMHVGMVKNTGVDCGLRFTISDEGRGMTPEELDALLVDPALRVHEGNMPYGFYVANALAVAEGGAIGIESVPGRGTTVTFDMVFKIPQTHKAEVKRRPSSVCSELKVIAVVRHAQTAQILQKHLDPYVAEVKTAITEQPLLNADALQGYDMVIIDQRLSNRELSYALKSRGVWLITLQSVLESTGGEGHAVADYQLSLPFTHEHIVEMLTVFYGEQGIPAAEAEASVQPGAFETFVSDADIPVTPDVSKKDFERFVGANVLVVEDNPINQRVIRGLLGDSGIHLQCAENGVEALKILSKEGPFDLVLMDINMPVLDGYETTRRLRQEPVYEAMPVVAFTGLNLKDQIERMEAAGMNAHMAKPLNIGRLYSVFNHFLGKTGSGSAA